MRGQSYIKNNSHQNNIRGGETKVMKKVLNTLLVLALIFTLVSPAFAATTLTTQQKFEELKAAGIISGDANGNMLALDSTMQRQQLAKIACTLMGVAPTPGVSIAAFAGDYKTGVWGFEQGWIQAAYNAGLMQGKGAAGFDATGEVTVAELLAVIIRSMGLENQVNKTKVPWYTDYMTVAAAQNLIPPVGAVPTDKATYQALVTQTYNSFAYNKPAPAKLAVESVTQLNGIQLKVAFNKAVNKDSAQTLANYEINDGTGFAALAGIDAVALQDDGKSVIITLNTYGALVNDAAYAIKVKDVKDAGLVALSKAYITSILASDKVAPTLVSATSKAKTTTKTITLTFSEPVPTLGAVTVDGVFAGVGAGAKANQVAVTTASNLEIGKTYTLSVMNFADSRGNQMTPNPVATTVTVVADNTAPNLVSASFTRDSQIELVFDKEMNLATLVSGTSVKVLDANLSNVGVTIGAAAAKPKTTDGKSFVIPVTALPFNTQNVFSGIVLLTDTVADVSGNKIAATTRSISVAKDLTAPQIVNVSYKNVTTYNGIATANGAIVVTFNEPVVAGGAALAGYTAVTNTGAIVAPPAVASAAMNPNNNLELVVGLSANVAQNVTSYLVLIPGDAARDLSQTANQSQAANFTVDMSAGVPVASDTIAPTVSVTAIAPSNTTYSVIDVTFVEAGSGLNLATVVNTNNYKLDGLPLPAGSYITVAGLVAKINIPNGTLAEDKNYILNITGISDIAGNVILPFVDAAVALDDNIKPVLTAGVVNADGTMTLAYSEKIGAGAYTLDNYVITVDGAAYTASQLDVIAAGADAGKVLITPTATADFKDATTITVKTVDGTTDVADTAATPNQQKLNTTITVK